MPAVPRFTAGIFPTEDQPMLADACKLAILFSVWLAVWHVLP
jgi:hypothetical protein